MNIRTLAPHALEYKEYCYLWSPRPELKFTTDKLQLYDNGDYIAQPKLNGSNTLIFISDKGEVHTMNRHNEIKKNVSLDYSSLYRGTGWLVLNGEWMDKSQANEHGQNFNNNFVIFDILVYDGYILCGSQFQNRVHLLNDLYDSVSMQIKKDGSLSTASEFLYHTTVSNVWRVASFERSFKAMYNVLTPIQMYEGLVLKRKDALLQPPYMQSANSKWQIKFRKPNKIYNH